jgi:quinone-modifying oxidoreductase, subunit QmoA
MRAGANPVLVIGGGIAGISTAVELADTGCRVILVERSDSLGGRVARMHQYFPKLCPPSCGLEMHYRRLRDQEAITVLTRAEVIEVTGSEGDYQAVVELHPRYVSESCTLCGDCVPACPVEQPNGFDYGLTKRRAVYLPHAMAFPPRYAIERESCADGCTACQSACKYHAIDLDAPGEVVGYRVSAIVAATGWKPYDANQLSHLGFGKSPNVVTNVMLERMAAVDGPTAGQILRPSDGREPHTVAFVQCAGSRDENHLPYCSSVCCAASIKQACYIRSQYPATAVTIFYIDIRTPGKLEEFYTRAAAGADLRLVKGKVAKVEPNAATGDLLVTAEDALTGAKRTLQFELVVLATGMQPETDHLPAVLRKDELGFLSPSAGGLFAAGCVRRPADVASVVQDATGAALEALQSLNGSVVHAG